MRLTFKITTAAGLLTTAFAMAGTEPQRDQRTFGTPEEGARALVEAARNQNKTALHQILGSDCAHFLSGDDARDGRSLKKFAEGASSGCVCTPVQRGQVFIEIGTERWPFPIPLERQDGQWFFDTRAGREEILNRRIGSDELHAIGVCRAFARETKPELTSLLAQVRADDSTVGSGDEHACHGYIFKATGPNGSSTLIAYPAQWGRSGVMTFAAGRDGKVYQRDLGEKTAEAASKMGEFKPNHHWKIVRDQGVQDWPHSP